MSTFSADSCNNIYISPYDENEMSTGEMRFPTVRLVSFLLIGLIDTGNAIYYRYILEVDTKIGYAAHFAGAVAGFLLGIVNNYNICSQAFKAKT